MSARHRRLKTLAIGIVIATAAGASAQVIAAAATPTPATWPAATASATASSRPNTSSTATSSILTIASTATTLPPASASALLAAEPKNRVRAFRFRIADRVDADRDLSRELHLENRLASTTVASGSPLAAKGGGITPRHLGAAESPLSIAQRGGRHSGFLRQAKKWTSAQRTRASRNFQKQIELHEAKIDNPGGFIEGWEAMSPQHQQGLIRHWEKEIANFADQQSILHGL